MKTLRRDGWVLAALALMVLASLYAWSRVPETLPVHWGLSGEPDRYGGRLEALGIMPLIALLLYGLGVALSRFGKQTEGNRKLTRAVLHISLLGIAMLHLALVALYLGAELSVPRLASLVTGIILMGTGNLLPKAQPNRWVGVRTPWTYKSKESWYKSQRLGGWMMTLSGAALIVTALLTDSPLVILAVLGATLLATLGLLLYSYVAFRADETREPSL
jgi:uncharacterized membrane protein